MTDKFTQELLMIDLANAFLKSKFTMVKVDTDGWTEVCTSQSSNIPIKEAHNTPKAKLHITLKLPYMFP